MYRGTTPTVRWYIKTEEMKFEEIEEVWMTFQTGCGCHCKKILNIDSDDLVINSDEKYIQYTLSQEETLKFKPGPLFIQLRILMADGEALASKINKIDVQDVLKGGVI